MTERPRRVAAVDIGTNTALMLVAERRADGVIVAVEDHATITRLGKGVDRTRRLDDEAVARTLEVLRGYSARARALGAGSMAAVATSATRDSVNGDAFRDAAATLIGGPVEVATGEREALLTFRGALGGLGLRGGARVAVIDVGGGSTELVVGVVDDATTSAAATIEWAHSFDVGSVRMTERTIRHDPPTTLEIEAIERALDDAFAAVRCPPEVARGMEAVVAIAGTATTFAAIDLELVDYASAPPHGHRLRIDRLTGLIGELARRTTEERRRVVGLEPARADVIVAGGLVLRAAARCFDAKELVISDRGVRWGLAAELLSQGER